MSTTPKDFRSIASQAEKCPVPAWTMIATAALRQAADEIERISDSQCRAVDQATRLVGEKAAFLIKIEALFDAIKHGDEAHQAWLRQKILEHFA